MKKGFTLIELLAAITIIAVLTIIAIPTVSEQINKSKTELYSAQIKNIEEAARTWGADHVFNLPTDSCTTLTLGYLKDQGYLDISVTNPETNKNFSDDDVFVNISKSGNNYIYEVKTKGDKCEVIDPE